MFVFPRGQLSWGAGQSWPRSIGWTPGPHQSLSPHAHLRWDHTSCWGRARVRKLHSLLAFAHDCVPRGGPAARPRLAPGMDPIRCPCAVPGLAAGSPPFTHSYPEPLQSLTLPQWYQGVSSVTRFHTGQDRLGGSLLTRVEPGEHGAPAWVLALPPSPDLQCAASTGPRSDSPARSRLCAQCRRSGQEQPVQVGPSSVLPSVRAVGPWSLPVDVRARSQVEFAPLAAPVLRAAGRRP